MASVRLNGDTSGFIEISAPSVAGSTTITLPATSGGDFLVTDSNGDLNVDSGTLFVDASENRVGVGTSAPQQFLHIHGTNGRLQITSTGTGSGSGDGALFGYDGIDDLFINNRESTNFKIFTAGTQALTIDSSQRVGIGTTSPGDFNSVGDDLVISSTGATGITINAGTTDSSNIFFADSDNTTQGQIRYFHGTDVLSFAVNGGDAARIISTGHLGVGTTSPSGRLDVRRDVNGDNPIFFRNMDTTSSSSAMTTTLNFNFNRTSGGLDIPAARIRAGKEREWVGAAANQDGYLGFFVTQNEGTNERVRLQSNGTLVAHNTPNTTLPIITAGTWVSGDRGGSLANTAVFSSQIAGLLVAQTLGASNSAENSNCLVLSGNSGAATAPGNLIRGYSGNGGTTLVFQVEHNGNCQNTNNSFSALSDQTLKENIVPANSQWQDLKELEVVNYNFKEETGYETHTQLGVIAQQVEPISPGLVKTRGDGVKSVNYSVLYMKAVKALQEAMSRIETLETANASLEARLTALEGGN